MVYAQKIFLLLLLLGTISGCAAGRSAFNRAEKLEQQGKLDEAVVKYTEAAATNPEVAEFRIRLLKVSERAARIHFDRAEALFAAKKYDDAVREYQSAFTLDPSLERAKQMSETASKIRNSIFYFNEGVSLEKDRKPREAIHSYQRSLEFNPDNKEAKEAVQRLLKIRRTRLDGTELNLKSNKPITLKFKDAKIKEVFNILSQLSGINFIFDEALKDSNVSIFLENATFQQALDILTGINKLGKKTLNESTIIIYPKNPEKSKQYEELYVQTFFLNKLEAKKAVNLIRTMLQVKKIYVNEDMNAIVIRDTPEVIEVAQKILDANDVPDAELVLEVEVMEMSKQNGENFGLVLSRYAVSTAAAANGSSSFLLDTLPTTITQTATGGTQVATGSPANLLQIFNWNSYGGFLTIPNATFNFAKTLSNAETLANPRLRVKNREKAKFNVGQRVPITTTSTSGSTIGYSVNVQYVDVGVKLNAEPTVQLNNEVMMKLSLEVSSILSRETVGGDQATTVVTIGTRNLDTVLTLKDGETSIIGGLIRDDKTDSKQKVYLLGDIPVLGTLFSGNTTNRDKSELVLAITPHIVRGLVVPESDVAAFWSGKEDEPSVAKMYSSFEDADLAVPASAQPESNALQSVPAAVPSMPSVVQPAPQFMQPTPQPGQPGPQSAQPGPQSAQPGLQPVQPAPPTAQTQAAPALQPGVPAPAPGVPAAEGAKENAAATAPTMPAPSPAPAAVAPSTGPPPARATLSVVAPKAVKKNDTFTIEVQVSNAANVFKAPFTMVYDPIFVEFVGATEGGFLKQGGTQTTFQTTVDKNTGQIAVMMNRAGDASGVNGSGPLMTATFKARNQGPASFGFLGVNLADKEGKVQETIPFNTVVEVK